MNLLGIYTVGVAQSLCRRLLLVGRTNVTDRQTTDGRTGDSIYSQREHKFTFAKNGLTILVALAILRRLWSDTRTSHLCEAVHRMAAKAPNCHCLASSTADRSRCAGGWSPSSGQQRCGLRLWSCCKTGLRPIEFGIALLIVSAMSPQTTTPKRTSSDQDCLCSAGTPKPALAIYSSLH